MHFEFLLASFVVRNLYLLIYKLYVFLDILLSAIFKSTIFFYKLTGLKFNY